jgi:hypothetical protein
VGLWGRLLAGRLRASPVAAVAILCGVAGLAAGTASMMLFPHLSSNADESVYLLQADALRSGYLVPPAHEPAGAFQPWLTAISGDGYVPKQTPVHASIIASVTATGLPRRAALVVLAAGAVAAVYGFAREVLDSRAQALVAASLFAGSPLFVMQSATYLPYVSSLILLTLFAGSLLRALRTQRRLGFVAAGFLFSLAVFARPYDAVLFSLPFFSLLAWTYRTRLQEGARVGAWLLIGASVPLTAMALYFERASGRVSGLPFQLLDHADTIGFGRRRIFPNTPYVDFDFSIAIQALVTQLHLLVVWSCGGALLAVLTVRAMRRPCRGVVVATAAAAATTVGGYFFFWGGVNALSWGGLFQLGPWYTMPALVPLCVLGARGLTQLASRSRRTGALTVIFMAVFSVAVFSVAANDAAANAAADRKVWSVIRAADLDGAIVFVHAAGLGNPLQEAVNGAQLGGDVIWALDRGNCGNAAVGRQFPDRTMYQLELPAFWRFGDVPNELQATLRPLQPTCAPWERDPEGRALLPTHAASGTPAEIVTPDDDVPNPFVLVDNGSYYLYSSQTSLLSPNIAVRISDDRYTWSEPVEALPNLPEWATGGFTWAPDVIRVGDSAYVMWFTAGVRDSRPAGAHPMMCIGVAVSASPTGPFEAVDDDPTICQRERWGSIDPRTFRSSDGRLWLHWKSDDNADVQGDSRSSIYAQELAPDGVTLIGDPRSIIEVDLPWEGRIVEAPHMVEVDGGHWLFYSGNWFNQAAYAIGLAKCDGPVGPCTKASEQPWLASNAQGLGPGEASLFADGGEWWIVYSPTARFEPHGNARPVALAEVDFGPDGPFLATRSAGR